MAQSNQKQILKELGKMEKSVDNAIKGNVELKKEIERIKQLINYIPGSVKENKSVKAKK